MKIKGIVATVTLGAMLVCGVGLLGTAPAYAKKPSESMTRSVALKLKAAQDLIQKKHDYTGGIAKLNAMAGMPGLAKSPYAQHVRNQLYVFAYEKTGKYANLVPKLEALMHDPWSTPSTVANFTVALAQINYQLHHYGQAIKYGTEAMNKGYASAQEMSTIVGQAYYLKGDWRGTIRFEKQAVAAHIKAGHKPSKHSLLLIESSCEKLHDNGCLLDSLKQLVVYYPQREYWQYLLSSTLNSVKSDADLLEAYRLAFAVGVMSEAHEFTDYAELAIEAGTPGEAVQVLTSALNHNEFTNANTKAKAQRILNDAKKRAAKGVQEIDHTAALANKQATGNSDIRVGLAYYGYKQYANAIKAFKSGIAKGGLKKPAEAHLLLGIAELSAGNRGAALQAFRKVKGNAILKDLASLWILKARSTAS